MSFEQLNTPALLLDADRVERNIAWMARKAADAGVALRPHFKTSKMLEVSRMQRAAGAIGHTCATAGELKVLQDDGVERILWGQQPVGRPKLDIAVAANRRGEVIVALDGIEVATALGERAAEAGQVVPCVLEVDTGMNRAGVLPRDVPALGRALADVPGLRLAGLMTHEGHVHAHLNDPEGLLASSRAAAEAMIDARAALAAAGVEVELVSTGTTPAARLAPILPGITELRPGNYVFLDSNQVSLGSATWDECAVTILARVMSRAKPGTVVIDAGLKALSGDGAVQGPGRHGKVVGLDVLLTHAYEEHGVLEGEEVDRLQVGDLVQVVPNHACGAVNMWSHAVVTRAGEVLGEWEIQARW